MNNRIILAEKRLKFAEDDLERIVNEVQDKCKHPIASVHETGYKSSRYDHRHEPPFRICTKCGLAEEGWGIGYHFLPETETTITRDEAQSFVTHFIDDDEKCKRLGYGSDDDNDE